MKMKNSTCHFLMILTLTFDIYFTQGIIWISKPSTFNKCIGQTVNLTWEYMKEPSEEVKQLQWLFNTTELIAYSSAAQGFNVELKYKGRVDKSGETGILLKNISTTDMGNYTFYPLIAWEKNPNMQTVELNVIEPTMEQECLCEKLPISPQWNKGQMYSIMASGCHLEINSSFCCPKGPAIEYCENDPQKRCVPISLIEAPTGNRELSIILHDLRVNKCIIISVLAMNCVMCIVINYICLMRVLRSHCPKTDRNSLTNETTEKTRTDEMATESKPIEGLDSMGKRQRNGDGQRVGINKDWRSKFPWLVYLTEEDEVGLQTGVAICSIRKKLLSYGDNGRKVWLEKGYKLLCQDKIALHQANEQHKYAVSVELNAKMTKMSENMNTEAKNQLKMP